MSLASASHPDKDAPQTQPFDSSSTQGETLVDQLATDFATLPSTTSASAVRAPARDADLDERLLQHEQTRGEGLLLHGGDLKQSKAEQRADVRAGTGAAEGAAEGASAGRCGAPCGSACGEEWRWRPRRRQAGKGPDMEVLGARAAYAGLVRLAAGKEGPVEVETESEWGVRKTRVFGNAKEVAEEVLREAMETYAGGFAETVVDARVTEDAAIWLTTAMYAEQLREKGRLQCKLCAGFFAGQRGLRDHQIVAHNENYISSVESARRAATALVPLHQAQMWRHVTSRVQDIVSESGATPTKGHDDRSKLDPDNALPLQTCKPGVISDDAGSSHSVAIDNSGEANVNNSSSKTRIAATGASSAIASRENVTGKEGINLVEAAKSGEIKVVREAIEIHRRQEQSLLSQRKDQEAAALAKGRKNPHFVKEDRALKLLTQQSVAAMHWAAGAGHIDVVKMILEELNVSPEARDPADKLARTALHWAARKNQLDVVKMLVEEFNVDVNIRMKDGSTAFHYAVYGGAKRVCDYLRAHGADSHSTNQHGCNAAQWAAVTGSCEMLAYLGDDCELNLDIRSKNGHTILHKTAQRGHLEATGFVIKKYPHMLQIRDKENSSALDLARFNEHSEVAKLLAEAIERKEKQDPPSSSLTL